MSTIRYYVDIIRIGHHWVFCLMRTYQVRQHCVARGAVKVIAGAAHQSLSAQEGWMLLRLAISGSVSQGIHLVTRDLVTQ